MTNLEVITAKLHRFGVEMTSTEIEAVLADVSAGNGYNETETKEALLKVIPELLITPSVSEDGFSRKWDIEGLKAYVQMLAKELGKPNPLAPKVKNISDRW